MRLAILAALVAAFLFLANSAIGPVLLAEDFNGSAWTDQVGATFIAIILGALLIAVVRAAWRTFRRARGNAVMRAYSKARS